MHLNTTHSLLCWNNMHKVFVFYQLDIHYTHFITQTAPYDQACQLHVQTLPIMTTTRTGQLIPIMPNCTVYFSQLNMCEPCNPCHIKPCTSCYADYSAHVLWCQLHVRYAPYYVSYPHNTPNHAKLCSASESCKTVQYVHCRANRVNHTLLIAANFIVHSLLCQTIQYTSYNAKLCSTLPFMPNFTLLVSGCFEPSQPPGVISGLSQLYHPLLIRPTI